VKYFVESRRRRIRKATRIGQVYLKNCLLKQVIEGKIDVVRRIGRKKT
jgi:hypothetical protein